MSKRQKPAEIVSGSQGWKTVSLRVEREFVLDEWYDVASPREIGTVLNFASKMMHFIVEDAGSSLKTEMSFVRDEATRETIRKTLEEARKSAESAFSTEFERVKESLNRLEVEKNGVDAELLTCRGELKVMEDCVVGMKLAHASELSDLTHKMEKQNAEKVSELDKSVMEKDHALKLELEKLKCYERHLIEISDATLAATKKEMASECSQKCLKIQEQLSASARECDELKSKQDEMVLSVRQEERSAAALNLQKVLQDNNAAQQSLAAMKQETEQKLMTTLTEKMDLSEKLLTSEAEAGRRLASLESQVKSLQDPMSRGNYGEYDVAQTIREIGFHVEDTSVGEQKMEGFMDLLVTPSGDERSMRIAIEVKNKKIIKKATDEKVLKQKGDIADDIQTFIKKAKQGIEKNMFDAAIFVSIRAHTKMGSPVVLKMLQDPCSEHKLSPITFIGPEKAKHTQPLTQDQLETHVYMMFNLLEQLHTIKTDILTNSLVDNEKVALHRMVDTFSSRITSTFTDLRKLDQSMNDMKQVVRTIKSNCIHMFRNMYSANSQVPWLHRSVAAQWMPQFEKSKIDALTLSDASVWNKVSMNKTMIENTIGKDAMLAAIRDELKDVAQVNDDTPICTEG